MEAARAGTQLDDIDFKMQQAEDDDAAEDLEEIGLGYIFEVEKFRVKKSWFQTFIAGALGILQIVVEVTIAAMSGGFASFVCGGIISQGVSDVISSVMAVFTGEPIDLNQYFKSKGTQYAVSILTYGALKVIDYVQTNLLSISQATTQAQLNYATTRELITHEFTKQTSFVAAGLMIDTALDNPTRNIKQEAMVEVGIKLDQLFSSHREKLQLIIDSDRWEGDRTLQNVLYSKAETIISKYRNAFGTMTYKVADNVLTAKLDYGPTKFVYCAKKLVKFDYNLNAVSNSAQHFVNEFGNAIIDIAARAINNTQMLLQELQKQVSQEEESEIGEKLQHLDYRNCDKIDDIDFDARGKKHTLITACKKIVERIGGDISKNLQLLRNAIMGWIEGKINILMSHATEAAAGDVKNALAKRIYNFVQESLSQEVKQTITIKAEMDDDPDGVRGNESKN